MTLREILPTSRAPYRLRFLSPDFPAEGAVTVEWVYELSRNGFRARVRRVGDGRVERHVELPPVRITAANWTPEVARALSVQIVAELKAETF